MKGFHPGESSVEPSLGSSIPANGRLGRLDGAALPPQFAAMQLAGHPRIAIDPAVCGGRPIVAGTRMRVSDVLGMVAGGTCEADIAADFPYIAIEDVRACAAYAASALDHPVVLAAE